MAATTARLLLCATLAAGVDVRSYYKDSSPQMLAKELYVRGVECDGCTGDQMIDKLVEHAYDAVDPELEAMYAEEMKYKKHVNQLNMTKSALINQINASEGGTLSESRAERVWNTFNLSLHSGAITFLDNGTMQFSMPLTHHAAAYGVPDVACDLIEEMFLRMRSVYASRVPRKIRRRLEARLEYAADSGLIYGLVAIFGTLLLVDIATSTFDVTRSGAAAVDNKKED